MMTAEDTLPEQIGRYQIKSQIGRGGMGVIYLAFDPAVEREVVVKMLPADLVDDAVSLRRFQREAKVVAALEHEAILPLYDFGVEGNQPYLVMRYMRGGSLEERLQRGRISLAEAVRIIAYTAPGLDFAHAEGVIHRDIKPSNILFDLENKAYLTDFGIARLIAKSGEQDSDNLTGEGVIGTIAYISPELLLGDPDPDGRSDIYSLGVMLFEMLTGNLPFFAATPTGVAVSHVHDPVPDIRSYEPDLPARVQAVIAKAMAKDRESRYPTAAALGEALSKIVDQMGEDQAQTTTQTNKTPRPYPKGGGEEPAYIEACAVCGYDLSSITGACPECGGIRRLRKARERG